MMSHICPNCGNPIGGSCLCWLTEYALKVSSDDGRVRRCDQEFMICGDDMMSDTKCEICNNGISFLSEECPHDFTDFHAEIARLRAELEKAEMERDDARDYAQSWRNLARTERIDSENWKLNSSEWKRTSEAWQIFAMQMCDEYDEARKWARRLYKNVRIQEQLIYHLIGRDEDGE